MEEIRKRLEALSARLAHDRKKAAVDEKLAELDQLTKRLNDAGIWQNPAAATELTKRQARLNNFCQPWQRLSVEIGELKQLAALDDASLAEEMQAQTGRLENELARLQQQLSFSGRYDDYDAIIRLTAGAGGTDAQDWTAMLLRMYLRWAKDSHFTAEVIEQSAGEEAGLKSAVASVTGPFAYGKLRCEHGVHRLVRLSPFNADNLRQTSFALVEVLPQIDAPEEVVIDDKDLKVDVFRAGGHGGQSVNTTDSAVRLTHLPTGLSVAIQNERSQLQNKETAMKILRSKLAQLQLEQHQQDLAKLKGPAKEAAWGNQIRNYVLHPYALVKDTRTKYEERDAQAVLDGKIDGFINACLAARGQAA
ncbi:MAG: peptide chain release factor 2 [Candidatus Chaera renei]|uniref:Peptide chain release factor 2 n=1 Tax=Candidatus Chaera renei TaxID=2506947 RepID=A0A4Q0AJC1_9BACT|nr:MAG: peptide chain release factor 2 [Candidatus Chaera renei]